MAAQKTKPTPATHTRGSTMPHDLTTQIDTNSLLDTKALAVFLSISPVTLVNLRSTGESPIAFVKIGRLVRYRYSDTQAYLNSLPKIQA